MNLIACRNALKYRRRCQTLLIMRLTALLLLVTCLSANAKGYSQSVTLTAKDTPLEKVFAVIKKQTGYTFAYTNTLLRSAKPVTISIKDATVEKALDICFEDQPLNYTIVNKTVVVFKRKEREMPMPAEHVFASPPPVIVTGKVINEKNEPIARASVTEKGTSNGTTTKENGSFSLNVANENSVLVFSFIGYVTQEIRVGKQVNFTVSLQPDSAAGLGEVVVVGYGTQRKATLTGAVSSITSKELKTTTNANVTNMLAGKLPGLRVVQRNSEPGNYSTDFDIRGFGNPLIIVDGVPRSNFNRLDPNEIESVSILKDASAAVYGVQAANGVILITTKRGKAGQVELNYSNAFGWSAIANSPDVMNAYEYATLVNEADLNSGKTTPTYSNDDLQKYKDGTYPSTDWYRLVVRKYTPQMQHNLSASGGSEKIRYFLSLGYFDEQGIWKTGDLNYKRYNFRSNITAQITKNLEAEFLINGIMDTKKEPGEPTWIVFKSMWMQKPIIPVYANNNPDYLSSVADATHPLAITNAAISGYRNNTNKTLQASFALNYKVPFVDGLKARFMYSYDNMYSFTKQWKKRYALYDYDNAADIYIPTYAHNPSTLSEWFDEGIATVLQASLNYEKRFHYDHHVNALLLIEKRKSYGNNFSGSREFSLDVVDQLFAGNALNQTIGSGAVNPIVMQGLVGRINYDYKGKYLVEGSFRNDGSSKFAEGHRWGFFPGVSAGWRISEENFFKGKVSFVKNLKLRASYGKLGDDASSTFQYLAGYNYPGPQYILNNNVVSGLGFRGMANPNITWYTSRTANIGMDADLFSGRLHVEFDVFRKKREGLLATRNLSLPGTVGAGLPQENLNSDLREGFELLLSHNNHIGAFNYNVSGNASFTRGKTLYVERAESNNSYKNWRDNNSYRWDDTYWGYHVTGQFGSMEEIKNSPIQDDNGNRNLLPGDLKYEDFNNDGIIDDNDVKPIGRNSGTPQVNLGFSFSAQWKGFDVNLLLQGATKFTISYLGSNQLVAPMPWGRNGLAIFTDRWHRENMLDPNSAWVAGKYPSTRPSGAAPWNYRNSDFWLRDASYLRLKSVEIGYTIPSNILNKKGIKGLRVYTNGFNLFTLSGLNSVVDPEHTNGTYGLEYPITRNYNFGINLTF
jgi:TonB-linked SusC/RagA family outer membrane protein